MVNLEKNPKETAGKSSGNSSGLSCLSTFVMILMICVTLIYFYINFLLPEMRSAKDNPTSVSQTEEIPEESSSENVTEVVPFKTVYNLYSADLNKENMVIFHDSVLIPKRSTVQDRSSAYVQDRYTYAVIDENGGITINVLKQSTGKINFYIDVTENAEAYLEIEEDTNTKSKIYNFHLPPNAEIVRNGETSPNQSDSAALTED
ncbi:MAG: hypothetical protein NC120_09860 [Ruminococcus sp.]|nr:hypothetical protein [Ruminococcus sp.]